MRYDAVEKELLRRHQGLTMRYSTDDVGMTSMAVIILFAAVFFLYSNTFNSPFIFDDYNSIQANAHIHLTEFSFAGLRETVAQSRLKTRPVAYLTFALNYYFNGLNPLGYHLVNIFIHALNAVLLFFLFRQVLVSPAMAMERNKAGRIAFAAAFFWAAHPLATNSVTYIVQRMNSLAACFFIIAMLAYGCGCVNRGTRRAKWCFSAAVIAAIFAMGSKENAFTLPFFLLLYDWFFYGDLGLEWFVERRRELMVSAIVIVVLGICVFVVSGSPLQLIRNSYLSRDFNLSERLMTEWRVMFFYLSLIFLPLPARMNLDHYFSLSKGIFTPPQTFFSLLGLLILVGWAVASARRRRLWSFAILWFFGNLVIESSFIGLELVFEHRTYLPSMFLFPALVLLFYELINNSRVRAAVFVLFLLLSGWWTWQRNQTWRSEVVLRLDCARKSPQKARPQAILANALVRAGELAEAEEYYRAALRLAPRNSAEIEYNFANLLMKTGKLARAEALYRKVSVERPDIFQARLNLGYVLMRENKLARAEAWHRELVADFPGESRAHFNFAILLQYLGKRGEAAREFQRVLELDPGNRTAAQRLAGLRGAGRFPPPLSR